jgi:C1A family cysteine protease
VQGVDADEVRVAAASVGGPSSAVLPALPRAVDLRGPGFPSVQAQGELNSCTAHVLAALVYHDMFKRDPQTAFEPSRLFLYYNQRDLRHEVGKPRFGRRGAPVCMPDAVKSIRRTGFCREAEWPYDPALADVKPPASLYEFAARQCAYDYSPVPADIAQVKACLAEGFPVACGIVMYQSFFGPAVRRTGMVSLPAPDESLRGGHAVALVGYDDARRHFIARNSFGPDWGDRGHCYLPYDFLANPRHGFDFWIVRSEHEGAVEIAGTAASRGRQESTGVLHG